MARKNNYPPGSDLHRVAARTHSCRRLYNRYDVIGHKLQRELYDRHHREIEAGEGELIGTLKDGSQVIRLDGRFYAVWKPALSMIVTYLTMAQVFKSLDLEFLL